MANRNNTEKEENNEKNEKPNCEMKKEGKSRHSHITNNNLISMYTKYYSQREIKQWEEKKE